MHTEKNEALIAIDPENIELKERHPGSAENIDLFKVKVEVESEDHSPSSPSKLHHQSSTGMFLASVGLEGHEEKRKLDEAMQKMSDELDVLKLLERISSMELTVKVMDRKLMDQDQLIETLMRERKSKENLQPLQTFIKTEQGEGLQFD